MEATGHIRKEYESKATGPFGPLYSAFLTDRGETEHFPWALTGGWTSVMDSMACWDLSGDDLLQDGAAVCSLGPAVFV